LPLPELNDALWGGWKLLTISLSKKQEDGRVSSFAEEKPFLRPLPPRPFEYIKQKVSARLKLRSISISAKISKSTCLP